MSTQEFLGRRIISFAAGAVRIPFKDGLAMTWSLSEADGSWNHASVEPFWEIVFDLLDHFTGKVGAPVIHGHEDSFDFKAGIDAGIANLVDYMEDL